MIEIRKAETDADLEAWRQVRLAVLPDEAAATVEQMRALETPERLVLLAELDGELAGSGLGGRSDTGNGFVAPRVLPSKRRRGVGSALLQQLLAHVERLGFDRAGAHVDGRDAGSLAFAHAFGFDEIDRQVEQVRAVGPDEEEPPTFAGVEFLSVAERPELLEQAYELACEGYSDLVVVAGTVVVSLEQWLRDEATLPEGSFVALVGGEIVGYSGLVEHDNDGVAEDGLTVVHRTWRRRGLGFALKRLELAWAAEHGYREIVTWTQPGNEGMRQVNELLGYEYRDVVVTMVAPLPLP
jgi:mycothiol synthase